ncbi:hypothetical protein BAE44_0013713 [Dichanthelium oligosanthes]|uniref:EGG APPARATUS-1 protein n=1 Tax=Dichanthelium oligosanthes TaxID=888268 RepID=A0A1E5VJG8_9POAL|nr:hypothetical protein BAE44_0013713 [Dichanthelium oligosanthes]
MATSTTAAEAATATREPLGSKLGRLKEQAKGVASRYPVAGAAAVLAVGAVGAYFLWPVAAPAVAMMKAPGAGGVLVSRAAFLANKKLYFKLLHTAGAAAAVAALA